MINFRNELFKSIFISENEETVKDSFIHYKQDGYIDM